MYSSAAQDDATWPVAAKWVFKSRKVSGLGSGVGTDMTSSPKNKESDKFDADEATRRFEKLVKAALNTRPKPRKSMTPKDVPAQSKKRRKTAKKPA